MFNIPWIEYVGYAASILIGISMFMKNIIKLRFINLIGSILFTIYGFIINAYPVAIVNLVIAFTNIYYLYKLTGDK
ncbi:YgjV family protein [uncultured Clostridium sp.]|uniref:YgjV family protein n=1 Tax=uncultured Clostridium sp. TaxID=59620 RepID=UPI0025E4A03F|nr:YgjV family protein [uncultured Clostridium sp.]